VYAESKTVASLAQLSDMQERNEKQQLLASKAIKADKQWFCLGVSNLAITAYLLGAFPAAYFLFYVPKVIFLILLRLYKFYQKKQHFLLWDFCYWANFLCIFYCVVMPSSPTVFRIVFMCANGPLAWSVLAFNHALIFHSYAHVTSVAVHMSPLVLTYGLRWYAGEGREGFMADRFSVCDAGPESCSSVSVLSDLVGNALVRFYLWWMCIYYLWIFVALGSYIEKRNYQTLWDRILVMKPVGPWLKGLLKKLPKLVVQLVYLLIHLVFSTVTMCVAAVLWYSQVAHALFLFTIFFCTVKNASSFYFEAFESQYAKAATDHGESPATKAVSKKLASASAALGGLRESAAAQGLLQQ